MHNKLLPKGIDPKSVNWLLDSRLRSCSITLLALCALCVTACGESVPVHLWKELNTVFLRCVQLNSESAAGLLRPGTIHPLSLNSKKSPRPQRRKLVHALSLISMVMIHSLNRAVRHLTHCFFGLPHCFVGNAFYFILVHGYPPSS